MKVWVNLTTEDDKVLFRFAVTRGNVALGGKINQEPLQVASQIRELLEQRFETEE